MHSNTSNSTHSFYRSRNGIFFGVCRGLAEWRDFSVGWTRFAVVLLALFTGFWPVFLGYIIAGLILKPAPVLPPHDLGEKEFYDSYAHSRKQALHRLTNLFEQLDRRTRRVESIVTSSEYRWNQKMDS